MGKILLNYLLIKKTVSYLMIHFILMPLVCISLTISSIFTLKCSTKPVEEFLFMLFLFIPMYIITGISIKVEISKFYKYYKKNKLRKEE